jgi:uncharacterized phiE125 gp8 family phage protein
MSYLLYRGWPWDGPYAGQQNIRIVTPADTEQITLAQARSHLRLDTYGSPETHPDDDMIEDVYIPAARRICEEISGRSFAPQVFEMSTGQFPTNYVAFSRNGIALKMGPVRGVTSVIYNDGTQDVTLDASAYVVDPYTDGGYLFPTYGTPWPAAGYLPNAVRVRFAAGYDAPGGSPSEFPLPAEYRLAMLLALGHVYENRENSTTFDLREIPLGINALLRPSSLVNGFA